MRCQFFKDWIARERRGRGGPAAPVLDIAVPDEVSFEAFYIVVAYLYTTAIPPDLSPTTLLGVLVTAQNCGLADLRVLCENLILGSVDPSNVITLLTAAHLLQQSEIKEMALDFVTRHMDAVKRTGTLDMLRNHPELMLELLKM